MVIQIKFTKDDPNMGNIKGLLRIDGKKLFFKFNNSDVANSMIAQLQQKGAIITNGRKWIRANIFGNHERVKLGGEEFDPKEKTPEQLEIILTQFYQVNYARAGFEIVTTKI